MRYSIIVNKTIGLLLMLCMLCAANSVLAQGQNSTQVVDVSKFPPVDQDIQALANYGRAAQAAGQRLVERGYDAVNDLNAALLDPVATFPQKLQLITVLGEIGDPDSVEFILDVARQSNSRYLYQNTLLSLAKFEPTDQIRQFVDQQLATSKRDPLIQRSALAYYAEQPTPEAKQWVTKYAAASASPDVRYAALYLGGQLGMASVKTSIVDLLQTKQHNTREYYLLLGLADVTTPEEFAKLISGLQLDPENVKKVTQYIVFRNADAAHKDELAKDLLAKGDMVQKMAARDYLIKHKKADALVDYWKSGDGFVRDAVKRSGYEIDVSKPEAVFKKRERVDNGVPLLLILAAAAIFLLVLVILYMQRRNRG